MQRENMTPGDLLAKIENETKEDKDGDVICLSVTMGCDEPAEIIRVGRTWGEIQRGLAERLLQNKTPESIAGYLKSCNAVSIELQIEHLALTQYCDQFRNPHLLPEIGHYLGNMSDEGEELTITIKRFSKEKMAEIEGDEDEDLRDHVKELAGDARQMALQLQGDITVDPASVRKMLDVLADAVEGTYG